ncbi:MAG: glutaredoxin family protein [Pseudomonadota bacterium]|nr:thioredoxin family protein [Pseudomonadales bacterium]MDY6918846.1 glutaredoxin family protein [Pseudomonadota bacterium]
MKQTLIFYTTAGCHLCELARAIWQTHLDPEYCAVQEVDIATDDTLIERYGTRIPVLRRQRDGRELNWPFTVDEVVDLSLD